VRPDLWRGWSPLKFHIFIAAALNALRVKRAQGNEKILRDGDQRERFLHRHQVFEFFAPNEMNNKIKT